jgi:hypothetical protein
VDDSKVFSFKNNNNNAAVAAGSIKYALYYYVVSSCFPLLTTYERETKKDAGVKDFHLATSVFFQRLERTTCRFSASDRLPFVFLIFIYAVVLQQLHFFFFTLQLLLLLLFYSLYYF